MDNENTGGMTPHREVDIPARFIAQAHEHLRHTRDRYVTFLFIGEQLADAVCIGIATARRPMLLVDHQEAAPIESPSREAWTIDSLTEEVILGVIETTYPINTRNIGNTLGIAGNDVSLRQRIRRVLTALAEKKLIRRTGGAIPSFMPIRPSRMKLRPTPSRTVHRNDITDDMVLTIIREEGPINSRTIGDRFGIPRPDSLVRSKITEVINRLQRENLVGQTGTMDGGRHYEAIPQQPNAEDVA